MDQSHTDQIMESSKPEEKAETASNQQIDREMHSNEEEFAGSKPVPDGFFADINNSQACSVRVAVKCRPLLGRELCDRQQICLETDEAANTITIGKDRCFTFDKVFGIGSAQQDVFEFCVKNLVLGCFQGYNATVLAYGQTGSGKTFTMGSGYTIGVSEENQGIIPRVNKFIFDEIEARKSKAEFIVKCAFIEIYNEELVDLLDCSSTTTMLDRIIPQKKEINIREEKNGMISVYPLKEVEVKTPEELAQCLDLGSNQRSVASTLMNQQSSRSHGIFTITIEQHFIEDLLVDGVASKAASQDEFMIAKFHFVDLAGSERAKKTGATGATMKEGININKSLLSLGNVIAALTDETKKNAHVPYRDSKLTRILQDSLGGNSRTSMIACCSPAEFNFEETLNTLKYASRARNIKNKPVVNRDPASLQIAALRQQVYELQMELSNTRDVLTTHQIPFQATIVLPAKNSLMQMSRQVQPQPLQQDLMTGAEIKKMESTIHELKANVASKEKELQQTRAKLEALQDQHQRTQIEQFGAQRDRDLCRYQLEQVISALKKHKTVYLEVVKEINHGKLPSDFNPATATADQILDPVFGSAGPTILQEYQTKVEEQRIEMEKQKLDLQQFITDNQQLIEQASRDMKSLEAKELEIERLKRQVSKQQKEIEQIRLEQRKQPLQGATRQATARSGRRGTELAQFQDANHWISNDLDNKIKHFEEVRKGFIEEMTNQMSKALVPAEKGQAKNDSDMEADEEIDGSGASEILEAGLGEDSNLLDASQIDDDKDLLAKINTQQREVSKLDSQMLEVEEVLAKFKASQRDMEQSLLKAMEEEYHNKIHQMQNELKRLDAAKSEDLKKATGVSAKSKIENQFKQKENELQTKLAELKLKEREQSKLQSALSQQKVKSKSLESELEKLKQNKVQMLKKMQDDQAAMVKWKKQRAQEVMDLKKQILKRDKENDALKRENKKREIFAKRKQEEVIAMQQRQKLDQAKRQNATKQRQESQNVDADRIKQWILSQTEKYVDYRDIETEKDRELQECDRIESEIESQQELFSKLIVAVEKLEQQKSRLMQAPEGTQDDKIYQLSNEIEDFSAQMKDIQSHIESLEDKQAFINEKVSKYNCDLIRLKDPANSNVLEESPLQSMEGVRATVQSFFDILLDLNMALRNVESELEAKEAKLQSIGGDLDMLNSEIELVRRQKSLELKQVHQEYMEKEHKLIQFMVDNTGIDLGAKADEESLQDINIQTLLSLFLKQKSSQPEQKENQSINPGIVKASVATQRLKEEKQEAFAQSKAALARQVAELERQLQEVQVINKRLKNDQAQANAEKSKYKRLYDNEIDKNKKRPGKEDLLTSSHNFLNLSQQAPGGVQAAAGSTKLQNLQNQRNQRKIKKMITTITPNNEMDAVMIGDEEEEEEKQHSPTKPDVFSRLSQVGLRQSTRARDAKHSFFGARRSSETPRQSSPVREEFEQCESVDEAQDLQQSWELVIDKPDAHKSQIYAMTSVGTHIYSSANKSLKIWDVETMKYISDLPEKIGLVKAIAFWNERNLLLTAAERVIMMWDVISLTTVGKFVGFKEEIKALQLVPGTDLMFAASKGTPTSGALLIYDLRKSQQPLDEKEKSQDIFSLTASQSHIFYGCRNHTVNPFCIKTFTSLASLSPPHFDVVTSLAILGQQQNSSLISGSRDKNLRRYGIKDQYTADEAVLNAHNDQINALETDRDRTTLYSGSRDGIVKVWSMSEPETKGEGSLTCRAILEGNSQNSSVNTICKLEIDPSVGQAFACGSTDRSIRIWKYSHGSKLHTQRVTDSSQRVESQNPVAPKSVEEPQQVLSTADRLRQRRLEKQLAQQNFL